MRFAKIRPIEWLFLIVLSVLTIWSRTVLLEGRLTFEWDQARDMEAVQQMVTTHKPALVGPIVRGEAGGFYLGPWYYYVITPIYLLGHGNPTSLAIVSVGADVLMIFLLYFFLRTFSSKLISALSVIIWAGSPLLISNAFTPWNVSFIHIWMLAFIWSLSRMVATKKFRYKFISVLLASLTTSIHVSLIPVALVLLLYHWKYFWKLSFKSYLYLGLAALIPISPLILHDLLNHFDNLIRLKRFLFGVKANPTTPFMILPLIIEKYGYTIGRLITGEPYTVLGLAVTVILIIGNYLRKPRDVVFHTSILTILAIFVALLVYRDMDFAEYYFLPIFVPLFLLFARLLAKVSRPVILMSFLLIGGFFLYQLASARHATISPYSLTVKRQVVSAIGELGYPVEVRTSLPRERNTGFDYLMRDMGVASDTSASRKAYIYEARNLEVVSPEEARSIILEKPIQAFKLIVFSN